MTEQQIVPYEAPRMPVNAPRPPECLTQLMSMPYAERLGAVTPAYKNDLIRYQSAARDYLTPASPEQIAAIILGIFEAFDLASPSKTAMKFWFEELGAFPAWALEKGARDLIREQSYKPQIADMVKRVQPHVSAIQGAIMHADMLIRYGREPEREEPVSEERKAAVRKVLEDAGLKIKVVGGDDHP